LDNRNVVLKIMHEEHMIDDAKYEHSLREKPKLNPKPPTTGARKLYAPYFIDHVLQVLQRDEPDVYDQLDQGGYKIYTTLESNLQSVAEKAVDDTIRANIKHKVNTGAAVLIDYKGRILAEVGGPNYSRDQFNVVVNGRRQPGSSFKSFLYSAAIDRGILDENSSVENSFKTYVDPY
jgi:membrane peptidoglycan carboxypeptidase